MLAFFTISCISKSSGTVAKVAEDRNEKKKKNKKKKKKVLNQQVKEGTTAQGPRKNLNSIIMHERSLLFSGCEAGNVPQAPI